MRQHSLMTLVGMLALLLGSCTGGDETAQQSPTPSSPAASASASPSVAASSASLQPSPTVPFSTPLVAQQSAKQPAVPGLVQPTNSDARAGQVQKGRKDPFAIIPIVPVVKVSPTGDSPTGAQQVPKPVPSIPTIPLIPLPPSINIGIGGPSKRPATITPKTVASRPVVIPRIVTPIPSPTPLLPNFKPELPRLPEPTLAQSVEVSGVVQVGNQPEAIVKAPNEPTSRYVAVGQRLANGQVLVKRIEMNQGNPVVIFEQYGIEVAKAVGEKSVTPNQQFGRPAAAVPRGFGGSAVFSPPA